jgi:hypothetical protein
MLILFTVRTKVEEYINLRVKTMHNESKFIELKRLTLEKDANFSELANYFFDISEDPEFIKSGENFQKDEEFFKVLLNPVAQYFGKNISVSIMYLIRIETLGFVHGSAILSNGILVPLYFFEDHKVGLAMAHFNGTMQYFRISAKTVPLHKIPVHLITTTMQ